MLPLTASLLLVIEVGRRWSVVTHQSGKAAILGMDGAGIYEVYGFCGLTASVVCWFASVS
jgi:hypothetical protein